MTILPVAQYAPDMPDLAEATNIANNVIPLTTQSYGPLQALATYSSNALDAPAIGMGYAEDTALTGHIFSGTPTKLWVINGTATSWTNVSGTTYAAGSENWRFAQYKNLMLATDFNDVIQSYNMISGGTFGTLSSGAPQARYIAVAKDFAIVGNTYDSVGGLNPARMWWSSVGDPTNWPTPGSTTAQQNQSDYNDMLGPQGVITGLAPNLTGCDCAVFFERGVFRMIYTGPPDIFDFYPAASVKGCQAPNSIVPLGTIVYYLGEDGFYGFDGNMSQPIGTSRVDKWFFANVDPSAFKLVIGAPDISNKQIIWIFRSLYAMDTNPDQALIYRWDIDRWSHATLETEWIARVPVSSSSVVVPLVQGQLQLGAINSSNELAFFAGSPLPAQIGTKVVQITPNARSFVQTTRPLVQLGSQSEYLLTEDLKVITTEDGFPLLTESAAPSVFTVAVSARNTYYDPEIFGPEVAPDISGMCPTRMDGRYHRGRITISGGLWSAMAGLDAVAIKSGLR